MHDESFMEAFQTTTLPSHDVISIDYESEDFPNTIWYNKGTHEILINLAMFLPLCLLGLSGNTWVLYMLKINKHIRTPTNLIVGNMAIADMLSLIIYPSFIFVYDYFQNYQLGEVGCKGEGILECTILLASVISMSAITYDRLTAIVLPTDVRFSKLKAKIIICSTWIIGCLISLPLAVFREYRERKWKNFAEKYCTEEAIIINIYWYVIITALVWLPLTIQIICYGTIFIKLNKYEKRIVKTLNRRHLGYKKSVARMMFIVMLTFMICRLPFTAFIIYRHQLLKSSSTTTKSNVTNMIQGLYHYLWFSSKYLLIVNAAINPVIYSMSNVSFRNAFKKTRLGQLLCKDQKKLGVKTLQPKQKHVFKTSGDVVHQKTVFFIFKKDLAKSTQGRDTSTKVVAIHQIPNYNK